MIAYSINNDKRTWVTGTIFIIFTIFYYWITNYLLIFFGLDGYQSLTLILSVLTTSSILITYGIISIFKRQIFTYCEINDVSGHYSGFLKTSWNNFETEIPAEITIEQTLFKINIRLETTTSGENRTAHVEGGSTTHIVFTYVNRGSTTDPNLKMHVGTGDITISNGKITGYYYNHPINRETYGIFDLDKIDNNSPRT